jgi:hypothetical protein
LEIGGADAGLVFLLIADGWVLDVLAPDNPVPARFDDNDRNGWGVCSCRPGVCKQARGGTREQPVRRRGCWTGRETADIPPLAV